MPRRNQSSDQELVHPEKAFDDVLVALKDARIALGAIAPPDYSPVHVTVDNQSPVVLEANKELFTQRLDVLGELSQAVEYALYVNLIAAKATSSISYQSLSSITGRSTASLQKWIAQDVLSLVQIMQAGIPGEDAPSDFIGDEHLEVSA